jgi:hypothetical protein
LRAARWNANHFERSGPLKASATRARLAVQKSLPPAAARKAKAMSCHRWLTNRYPVKAPAEITFPVITILEEPKRSIRMPETGAAGRAARLATVRPRPTSVSGSPVVLRK